ncbi:hypothetical protein ACFL96_07640 [Thermoproteota archaeon]
MGASKTTETAKNMGLEALKCLNTRDVPYFWPLLDSQSFLNPYDIEVPASAIKEPSQIPEIVAERAPGQAITSIDMIIQTAVVDPHNGRYKDPSLLIKKYYAHMRVKTDKDEEILLTLDKGLIDLYLTCTFHDHLYQDFAKVSDPDSEFPALSRTYQKIKDPELKPRDEFYELKVLSVIMNLAEKVVDATDCDISKCSLYLFEPGERHKELEVSRSSFESSKNACRVIKFEPTEDIPEQILDLRSI